MTSQSSPRIVVIGAGIAGLAAGAALAHAGLPVTVLEAHIYPGGCAASFRYQGHRYDAGATLVAGLAPGGPLQLLGRTAGIESWPARPCDPTMVVHLEDGTIVPRYADERRWETYRSLFPTSLPFWTWQEKTARLLWDFALRLPELRPRSLGSLRDLVVATARWFLAAHPSPAIVLDLWRPLARYLPDDPIFRRFIDAQLLIAAQGVATDIFALYGAAALDLPNAGVAEIAGGTGTIARLLVEAIQRQGGSVHFRQEVETIERAGTSWCIRTRQGLVLESSLLIANLTPWGLARIWPETPKWLRSRTERPPRGWGAFMLYVSLDSSAIPPGTPVHQQILAPGQLGEGRSVFLSLSPEWDGSRAPAGRRAATMSTHTRYEHWWRLAETDRTAYEAEIARYTERMLDTAARALPWLPGAIRAVLPSTPLAFQRFARRTWGWVGGFPQRHPFVGWPTEIVPGLYLVGDSVFPGQSIPATALAGLRVARRILRDLDADLVLAPQEPSVHLPAGEGEPVMVYR